MKPMKSIIGKSYGTMLFDKKKLAISPCIAQGNPDKTLRDALGHQMNKNDLV